MGTGASPDQLPVGGGIGSSGIQSDVAGWDQLARFLKAGIGADRPRKWMGTQELLAVVGNTAVTLPAGTNIVQFFVDTDGGDVHMNVNAAATEEHSLKKSGQEYTLGPLTNLVTLNFVRDTTDTTVWLEYYEQD